MDHQRIVADELFELGPHLGEDRLRSKERGGQAVYLQRFGINRAARIDVGVEMVAGGDVVHKFDCAHRDDAMAFLGIEAGGFEVEGHFTLSQQTSLGSRKSVGLLWFSQHVSR